MNRRRAKFRTALVRQLCASGLVCGALLCTTPLHAQAETIVERLYPGVAPGSEQWTEPEVSHVNDKGGMTFQNVSVPSLSVYAPASPPEAGTAMVLLPGGALRILVIDEDVRATIRTLNAQGVTVFLLKYRVLQQTAGAAPAAPGSGVPRPPMAIRNANANPFPNDAALSNVLKLATDDAQVALQRVRSEATRWHINPVHVGLLGYSAGGGVALALERSRPVSARANFIATAYGPSLVDVQVSADAPPLFIATETQHGAVTEGLLALAGLWRDAGRPVEMHLYDVPAFAMPSRLWLDRMLEWLASHQLLPAGAHS